MSSLRHRHSDASLKKLEIRKRVLSLGERLITKEKKLDKSFEFFQSFDQDWFPLVFFFLNVFTFMYVTVGSDNLNLLLNKTKIKLKRLKLKKIYLFLFLYYIGLELPSYFVSFPPLLSSPQPPKLCKKAICRY